MLYHSLLINLIFEEIDAESAIEKCGKTLLTDEDNDNYWHSCPNHFIESRNFF